jgi:O-acetyl-ADP-ribose deacetylase (regulator of RNase III)
MTKVRIELLKGDITERETDALVNTANTLLILGSGLGGAIKAKGGGSIAKECALLGPIKVGEAVITGAGTLKAKHIIHAALMEFDGAVQEDNIEKCLQNSLRLANRKRLKSISIPEMNMGIVRFEPERCARVVFTTLKRFLEKDNRSLKQVEVVLWDIETLRIYKTVYKEIFQQDPS